LSDSNVDSDVDSDVNGNVHFLFGFNDDASISSMASLARCSDRHAIMTVAPEVKSNLAVSFPMPVLAPVMNITLDRCLSAAVAAAAVLVLA
jgi:hypothetical protein